METKPAGNAAHVGHETRDASVRALMWFGVVLLVVLALTLIAMKWMFFYFAKTQPLGPPPTPFESARTVPPTPRLQVEPELDLKNYRDVQEQVLKNYGWVDKTNGVVRIPIDRAMNLLIERGLPVREQKLQENETSAGAMGARSEEPTAETPHGASEKR